MNTIHSTTSKQKKWCLARLIPAVLVGIIFIGASVHVANAVESTNVIGGVATFFGWDLFNLISEALANLFYNLQVMASWLVALAGALLNFSINLTMHIKEFVTATTAIYTVWAAIRDLSGMFIIFALLYAAIMLITGAKSAGFSSLIKNIVVAGVLINFSFFLTGLAIDVSNIVSLQLYNAIVPSESNTYNADLKSSIGSSIKTPGLSNIFLQSLGITRLYSTGGNLTKAGQTSAGSWSTPIKVIIIGITSIIIMITAALSFFLASIAFVVRFVILLFLLAFSPIVFAASVVPEIGKYSKMWLDHLKGQLVFMPAYLLLMYFALSVLTSSSIFKTGYAGSLTPGGDFASDLLVIGVNAVLIILMLNFPLVAAISLGAKVPGWSKNVDALSIWKKVGGYAGGTVGRGTVGWAGSKLDKQLANTRMGNSLFGRDLRAVTTGAAAKAKFGDTRSYEDVVKEQKSVKQKDAEISRIKQLNALKGTSATPDSYNSIIKGMNEKEKLGLGMKGLRNIEIIKHLKKSDFEAIKKSDEFTDEEKKEIKDLRKTAFADAITNGQTKTVGNMMKNMEVDEITDNPAHLQDDAVVANLKPAQLKKISEDALLTSAEKKLLGNKIDTWSSNTIANPTGLIHPAQAFVNKPSNFAEWL